jgi:anti-sigma B factor antagonist
MADFQLSIDSGVAIIEMPSRIDISNAKAMLDTLRGELDQGKKRLVLDFQITESIDSTALGALIQVLKSARAKDGELGLASVGDGVRRVLAITRVDRVFALYATRDAAVSALGGSA